MENVTVHNLNCLPRALAVTCRAGPEYLYDKRRRLTDMSSQ